MTAALVTVEGVTVRYGNAVALADVDLELHAGEVLAVLGSNGAGKSTLGAAISGLVPAAEGRISFDGTDVTKWAPHRRARLGIAHVPESGGVFNGLSVVDNLKAATQRFSRRRQREILEQAFALFPALRERSRQSAGTLSGGERQMLSLARVLSNPPRVLVADEMSLGLAPLLVNEVFENLRKVKEAGVAILLVEQFVERAVAIADRALILRRGSTSWYGSARDASGEVLAHYLGGDQSGAVESASSSPVSS